MKKLLLLAAVFVGVGLASTARAGVNLHVEFGIPLPPEPVFISHQPVYGPACPPRYVAPCPPPRYYPPRYSCPPPRAGHRYSYRQHGNGYRHYERYTTHGYGGNYRNSYRQYGGGYNGYGR